MDKHTAMRIAVRCVRWVYEDMLDHGDGVFTEEDGFQIEDALSILLDEAPDDTEDLKKIPHFLKKNFELEKENGS